MCQNEAKDVIWGSLLLNQGNRYLIALSYGKIFYFDDYYNNYYFDWILGVFILLSRV